MYSYTYTNILIHFLILGLSTSSAACNNKDKEVLMQPQKNCPSVVLYYMVMYLRM